MEIVFKREVYECLVQIEKELTSTRTTLLDKTHQVVDSVDIEEVWGMYGSHFEMSHEEWVQVKGGCCSLWLQSSRLLCCISMHAGIWNNTPVASETP